jgi:hypothetical protein
MSSSAFATVMSGLNDLSPKQLSAVSAAAVALGGSDSSRSSGTSLQRKTGTGKAGGGKTKGPAKQVSKYKDVKEYKDYKASEKALRSFLKKEGKVLKDYDPSAASLPDAVASFFEARQCFFRYKSVT